MKRNFAQYLGGGYIILMAQLVFGGENTAAISADGGQKSRLISVGLLTSQSTTLQPQSKVSAGEGLSQNGLYRATIKVTPFEIPLSLSMRNGLIIEYSYVDANGDDKSLEDTQFRLAYDFKELAKDLEFVSAIGSTLPISKTSQKSELNTMSFADAQFQWTPISKLSFGFMPRYYQYFHNVEVRSDGATNPSNGIRVFMDATYSLTEKLETGLYFWPAKFWTYRGATKDDYTLGYFVGYSILPNAKVSLGLGTAASSLKENGRDYNYTVYDPQQSTATLDLEVSL